jgi:hypothetical protein
MINSVYAIFYAGLLLFLLSVLLSYFFDKDAQINDRIGYGVFVFFVIVLIGIIDEFIFGRL